VALEIAAKEAKEQAGKVITPWEMELDMLEDWLNNPGPARELTEVELSGKMTEKQVSQRGTAELKSAAAWQLEATDEDEEEGMGDHGDLLNCRKFLQLRRLQKLDQPLEQLDASDRRYQKADVEVNRNCQRGEAEQEGNSNSAAKVAAAAAAEWSGWTAPQIRLGSKRIPIATGEAHEQELMIFAAVEYDAGASLHVSSQPASHLRERAFKAKERGVDSFKFEIQCNLMSRLVSHGSHAFVQAVDKIGH
jgi:hypothetical protein